MIINPFKLIMRFGGIQKTTLLDYPGEVACTLFVTGCNFRCPYCHNPELVNADQRLMYVELEEALAFLNKRKNVLGGVCITGGEPLLYDEMPDAVEKIRSLGLKVKIDTNGSNPDMLASIKADYIAMDIKTSLKKYGLVGYKGSGDITKLVKSSIKIIIESGTDHEFRTTVVPGVTDIDDIKEIAGLIKGAKRYILAGFRPFNTLDPAYEKVEPYPASVLEEMKRAVTDSGIECEIRGI